MLTLIQVAVNQESRKPRSYLDFSGSGYWLDVIRPLHRYHGMYLHILHVFALCTCDISLVVTFYIKFYLMKLQALAYMKGL